MRARWPCALQAVEALIPSQHELSPDTGAALEHHGAQAPESAHAPESSHLGTATQASKRYHRHVPLLPSPPSTPRTRRTHQARTTAREERTVMELLLMRGRTWLLDRCSSVHRLC
eukprot:6178414-Pleurochrysis_carterae.AAC.8